jgi:dihydrofolate synthase/folylpolyglutamate synthase
VRAVQRRMGLDILPGVTIVIGGTNGKGSVVALLESIYLAAGYSVGSYTSPHLLRYNERIRFGGAMVTDDALCDAFEHVDRARDGTSLTYFEFGTLAAADIFRSRQPDLTLLEVGLGGRLDAVNAFDADVALVTSIGIDHVEWLGDDRESVGREKAGIFRTGRPAICGDVNPPESVVKSAHVTGTSLYLQGRDFSFNCADNHCRFRCASTIWNRLPLPALRGSHQHGNVATALMAVHCLQERLPVPENAIAEGLRSAWVAARFQHVVETPNVVLDVAHNPDATRALAETCREYPVAGRTLAVVGMMKDKALPDSLATLVGIVDEWYLADLPPPRGATATALQEALAMLGNTSRCHVCRDVESAYLKALQVAQLQDRILVFGSFVSVGAIMRHLE